MRRASYLGMTAALVPWAATAQPVPSTFQGVPSQVVPVFQEQGAPTFTTPAGSGTLGGFSSPGHGGGSADGGLGDGGNGSSSAGGGDAYNTLAAQSYGATAIQTAQQVGNNPDAVAAFAQLESGFRNVPTSNGSSSATGPWQITAGTWDGYVSRYNLPYTSADRTDPNAQAVVANYILQDYSSQVSSSIGQPATVAQTYGAWVFGPSGGAGIASASDPNTPMSNFVSAQALANNNMTGWTVGQFYNHVESKIGSVSSETVRRG